MCSCIWYKVNERWYKATMRPSPKHAVAAGRGGEQGVDRVGGA
jgi:hypothetical protein